MARSTRRGGANPYRKGAAHENLVAKAYLAAGFPVVVRSPKSSDVQDVVAIRTEYASVAIGGDDLAVGSPRTVVHLVQCKMNGYMRPAERESLKERAREIGAIPVLAWGGDIRKQVGPIHRKDIRNGRELADLDYVGADGTTNEVLPAVDAATGAESGRSD